MAHITAHHSVTVVWCRRYVAVAIVLASLIWPGTALGQPNESAALAKQLTALMAERGLEVFAAQDSSKPDYFIAIRAYPGVQLLIVGAKSNSPDYIKYQIDQRAYDEAYAGLNASAVPDTKLFIQDMGCDGLQRDGDPVDVAYEKAHTQVVFDGNGKASGLSKGAYASKVTATDTSYAGMLALLLERLRSSPAAAARLEVR